MFYTVIKLFIILIVSSSSSVVVVTIIRTGFPLLYDYLFIYLFIMILLVAKMCWCCFLQGATGSARSSLCVLYLTIFLILLERATNCFDERSGTQVLSLPIPAYMEKSRMTNQSLMEFKMAVQLAQRVDILTVSKWRGMLYISCKSS